MFCLSKLEMGDSLFDNITGQKAIFGMCCFWDAEPSFGCLPEVIRVKAGYCGGTWRDPTYKRIGDHVEAVEVEYDPHKTSYNDLLEYFWHNHDYRTYDKEQHRSTIFYIDEDQKVMAETFLSESLRHAEEQNSGILRIHTGIKTQILAAKEFFTAEDYHQKHALQQHPEIVYGLKIPQNRYHKSHVATRLNGFVDGYGTMETFDAELAQLGLSTEVENHVRELITKHLDSGKTTAATISVASKQEHVITDTTASQESNPVAGNQFRF